MNVVILEVPGDRRVMALEIRTEGSPCKHSKINLVYVIVSINNSDMILMA